MKQIFYSLFTLLVFASCSKDAANPSATGTGSIEYKVNGVLIKMDNANIQNGEGVAFAKQLKGSLISQTRYLLNAQKGVNNAMTITLVTDSLLQTSYHYDSTIVYNNVLTHTFGIVNSSNLSTLFYNGDVFDVIITAYSNGRISGTFSGRLTPFASIGGIPNYDNRSSTLITEGKLINVPVTY
jgi:hypothetical protein